MRKLTNDEWEYIVSRVLRNAKDAAEEARQLPYREYKAGRALAYYEALDTIKNELLARDADVRKFGLDINLNELLSSRGEAHNG